MNNGSIKEISFTHGTVVSESVARLISDGGHDYLTTIVISASSDHNLASKGLLDWSH